MRQAVGGLLGMSFRPRHSPRRLYGRYGIVRKKFEPSEVTDMEKQHFGY
jgi:hypothetical protein